MQEPSFNGKGNPVCQRCGAVGPVYQRSTDEKWVCFDELPDEDIDRYPGWREKEALRKQRSAKARMNFGHATAERK
jgi:hypothetical protein